MNSTEAVGAFFDIDGTLLPAPSLEWRFAAYLLAHDRIPTANVVRWLVKCATTFARDSGTILQSNKLYLQSLPQSLAANWARAVSIPIFLEGRDHIAWHLKHQHRVFFVSGTLAPFAHVIASTLPGAIDVRATELHVSGDCWTGQLDGPHLTGNAKLCVVRALAQEHQLNLDRSYAYGNSIGDAPMLQVVGNPAVVNPSNRLARFARNHRWHVRRWNRLQDARVDAKAQLASAGDNR
jgi:alcohol-forming fatty acyl-CoA reductase